jgi:NADH:ubiquinone oxidoreductase subunit 4 (subunit M)
MIKLLFILPIAALINIWFYPSKGLAQSQEQYTSYLKIG